MIKKESIINISDNSGAKTAKCIHIISNYKATHAKLMSLILISVKQLKSKRYDPTKIHKGKIFQAIIIRTKKSKINKSGNGFQCKENTAILLSNQNKLIGTRIFGLISIDFRYTKFLRLLLVSTGTLKY